MAQQLIKMRIQFRRDTTANWEAHKGEIPAAGEPCYDIEKHTLKIGDGTLTYEQLPVIGGADEVSVSADGKSIVMTEKVFKLAGFDTAAEGAMPRRNVNGELEWVVPTIAPEKLKTVIESIETNVTNLSETVTNIQNIVTPSEEGSVPLLDRIVALEEHTNKFDAKVNEFFNLTNDNDKVDTLMEIINYVDKHGTDFAGITSDVADIKELVGTTKVKDQILEAINASGHMAEKNAKAMFEYAKYEFTDVPVGTLVDYRDDEIRVMVPAGAEFTKQSVGAGGDSNSYYATFKTYAPDNAVGYIEHLGDQVDEEVLTDLKTDDYGRKYQPTWLAIAKYDEATGKWTYYGTNSTVKKYIGWDYQIDWYDADGVMIASDCIRINLSNENCHHVIEPYYMANVVKGVSVGGTLLDMVDGKVNMKLSDEFVVSEDGTIGVGAITWDKIVNGDTDLVLDGGGAA